MVIYRKTWCETIRVWSFIGILGVKLYRVWSLIGRLGVKLLEYGHL